MFLSLGGVTDLCDTLDVAASHIGKVEGEKEEVECSQCSPTEIESQTEETQPVPAASVRDPDEEATQAATDCVIDLTMDSQPMPPCGQPCVSQSTDIVIASGHVCKEDSEQRCAPTMSPSLQMAIDSGAVFQGVRSAVSANISLVSAEERDRLRIVAKAKQLERLRAWAACVSSARLGN